MVEGGEGEVFFLGGGEKRKRKKEEKEVTYSITVLVIAFSVTYVFL